MCKFISFFHRPDNGDIALSNLNSHEDTQKKLNLNNNLWREGHYTPDGAVECRVTGADYVSRAECEERIKFKYPTFTDFFNYAMVCVCKNGVFNGFLDLSSLTSAEREEIRKKYGK